MTTKAVAVVLLLLDFMKLHMRLRVSGMGIEAQGLRRTAQELLIVRFLFRIPHSAFRLPNSLASVFCTLTPDT